MGRVRVTKRDSSQKSRRKAPEITDDVAGQIEEHWETKTGFSLLLMPPPWWRRGNQSYSKPGPPDTKRSRRPRDMRRSQAPQTLTPVEEGSVAMTTPVVKSISRKESILSGSASHGALPRGLLDGGGAHLI